MNATDQTTMGKKGEILPKRLLREVSGIQPGDKIVIQAHPGELVIKKVLSVEDVLALPIITTKSASEIEEILNEESMTQEELVD